MNGSLWREGQRRYAIRNPHKHEPMCYVMARTPREAARTARAHGLPVHRHAVIYAVSRVTDGHGGWRDL